MVPYRVIITPRAGVDLEAIYDYIARESAQNAAAMVTRILDALEPLKQFPTAPWSSGKAVSCAIRCDRCQFRLTSSTFESWMTSVLFACCM
jgi:hypothetical protein